LNKVPAHCSLCLRILRSASDDRWHRLHSPAQIHQTLLDLKEAHKRTRMYRSYFLFVRLLKVYPFSFNHFAFVCNDTCLWQCGPFVFGTYLISYDLFLTASLVTASNHCVFLNVGILAMINLFFITFALRWFKQLLGLERLMHDALFLT